MSLDLKKKGESRKEWSTNFEINTEVKKSDKISPRLFDMVVKDTLKNEKSTTESNSWRKNKCPCHLLWYCYHGRKKTVVGKIGRDSGKRGTKVGLLINGEKTKYLKISRRLEQENSLSEIKENRFGITNEFKNHDVTKTKDNREESEI